MARERKRRTDGKVELEMTPMIDVVFQLMIFFIVTLKQEDILARLDVTRPAPDTRPNVEVQPQDLLNVEIHRGGFILQGRRINEADLERMLGRIASYSKKVSVIIRCTSDSPHSYLMRVLDICAKIGLTNLNVFSM